MASEASATPLCSYAPQSNFSAPRGVSPPWTPGTQMLSSPDFPLPACAETFADAANRHQAPHFRRNFIMTQVDHSGMANAIRGLAMDAVEKAKSGHPGLPMGAADIATVLFTQFLKFDAADPRWPNRDRFILSAGHGSMLPSVSAVSSRSSNRCAASAPWQRSVPGRRKPRSPMR